MKNALLSDFTVDKTTKTTTIIREFNAEQQLVWDTFTIPEFLDQWVAPEPFKAKTKTMEFKVGGRRHYAMCGPEGQEGWSLQKYTSITPITNFKYISTFCDKDENEDARWPGSQWDLTFSERKGADGEAITKVVIVIYNESLERMEKMIEMGFKEGFMASVVNLEKLLERLS